MVGLLNIYTDVNLEYSWRQASELVAKTQGQGTNHARCIREWTMGFLRWRDLPFHQLNKKRGTILDDKDIAQEIRTRMVEKAGKGFLKAQDLVEIVASADMQANFAQKGISKPSISIKTVLRWLEKLGWTFEQLKNGMYSGLKNRCNVFQFWRSCDVALDKVRMMLSVGGVK